MFTGIVQDLGEIASIEKHNGNIIVEVLTNLAKEELDLGASILHDGVCLTITEARFNIENENYKNSFKVEVGQETILKTSASRWDVGYKINLEPSLKLSTPIGGHIVLGHVDGIAIVESVLEVGNNKHFNILMPIEQRKYCVDKGSICLNGTSLTINNTKDYSCDFFLIEILLIPHTLHNTNWNSVVDSSKINFESDYIAKIICQNAKGILNNKV